MIEVESEGNLVTLRMIGAVTSSDWDGVVPKFQEACGQATSVRIRGENRGAIRVLMDWRGLELWEPGARSDCTWFCLGNRDLVGRIAILGSPRWHDEKERLTDVYQKAEVKFFTPAESGSALVWLTGE